MDTTMLVIGGELMLLGMGIVFGFLGLLVVILRGMSRLASRINERVAAEPVPVIPIHVDDRQHLIPVIAAALARYRASRRP